MTNKSSGAANNTWDDLKSQLAKLKSLQAEITGIQHKLREEKNNLYRLIEEANKERREKVLRLLKADKKAICITHSLVFRDSKTEEWIVPQEEVVVVQMYKAWTTSHREYDGDADVSHHNGQYETAACKICRLVLSHGTITDSKWVTHSMMRNQHSSAKTCWDFYSADLIDKVSAECFKMPLITAENVGLL